MKEYFKFILAVLFFFFVFGAGVRNAIVTFAKPTGEVLAARTGALGYYRFDNLETGETYVVSVVSKRFSFAPQVVSVNDNISE